MAVYFIKNLIHSLYNAKSILASLLHLVLSGMQKMLFMVVMDMIWMGTESELNSLGATQEGIEMSLSVEVSAVGEEGDVEWALPDVQTTGY